jgi:hypothetical protein
MKSCGAWSRHDGVCLLLFMTLFATLAFCSATADVATPRAVITMAPAAAQAGGDTLLVMGQLVQCHNSAEANSPHPQQLHLQQEAAAAVWEGRSPAAHSSSTLGSATAVVKVGCSLQLQAAPAAGGNGNPPSSSKSSAARSWAPGPLQPQQEVLVSGVSSLDCLMHAGEAASRAPYVFLATAPSGEAPVGCREEERGAGTTYMYAQWVTMRKGVAWACCPTLKLVWRDAAAAETSTQLLEPQFCVRRLKACVSCRLLRMPHSLPCTLCRTTQAAAGSS